MGTNEAGKLIFMKVLSGVYSTYGGDLYGNIHAEFNTKSSFFSDMLATCMMYVHQGLGQWFTGSGSISAGMRLPDGWIAARITFGADFVKIGQDP